MRWSEIFPIIVLLLYIGAAVSYARNREYGWALAYFAYALANVGLIWVAIAGR